MPEWLAQRARISPDKLAIVCGDERWSFAELDRRVEATAQRLRGAGIVAGDRVALLAPNSATYAQVVFGVARAGAVLAPLNTRLRRDELDWQLADCDAAYLIEDATGALPSLADREGLQRLPFRT